MRNDTLTQNDLLAALLAEDAEVQLKPSECTAQTYSEATGGTVSPDTALKRLIRLVALGRLRKRFAVVNGRRRLVFSSAE